MTTYDVVEIMRHAAWESIQPPPTPWTWYLSVGIDIFLVVGVVYILFNILKRSKS